MLSYIFGIFWYLVCLFVLNLGIQIKDTDRENPKVGDVNLPARLPYRRFILILVPGDLFAMWKVQISPIVRVWSSGNQSDVQHV